MKRYQVLSLLCVIALLVVLAVSVSAQDMETPQVNVSDQLVLNGAVTIDSVYSEGPGFVVIHRASDGGVAGYAPVAAGWTYDLSIPIDTTVAEAKMSGMLHVDDNTVGTYEFGTVKGADSPVKVGDQIVNTLFNAQVLDATDQAVANNSITIKAIAVPVDSWVVVHSGETGKPGGVLGETLVKAGSATDVTVALTGNATAAVWPMLHVDDHEAGKYEFGTVDGADAPIALNGTVATFPIWTENHVRADDQVVVYGDDNPNLATMTMPASPILVVKSVLSQGPGFIVIHKDDNGKPGGVLGYAPVNDGLNSNVSVTLDGSQLTPVVWPMLHVDDHEAGKYEFGTVDGADAPAKDSSGNVVTFAINAAPALTVADQSLTDMGDMGKVLTIKSALMDAPGWIAIHTDNNGQPGPVIATALVHPGLNLNVHIPVDAAQAGSRVFPMLHYDTGEMGKYEFGTVDKTDNPVFVAKNVIFVPLNITQ